MSQELAAPIPRLTVITLGVNDIRASIAFYDALGFSRRLKVTGEAVAFYDTGGPVLALFPWDQLAVDAKLPDHPRPSTFRGMTLAWNCRAREEVDAVLAFAVGKGAALLKAAHETDTVAIPAISPILTAIHGKSWSRPASRSARTGGCIWRNRAADLNNGNCPRFPVAQAMPLAHDPGHDSGSIRQEAGQRRAQEGCA